MSNLYGEAFEEETTNINLQNLSDKFAMGIEYHNVLNFAGLNESTKHSKQFLFPMRLFNGSKPGYGDSVIIPGLHLVSSTNNACAVYPILCPTNKLGYWNGDENRITSGSTKNKNSFIAWWNYFKPTSYNSRFTCEELTRQFMILVNKYFYKIHSKIKQKEDAESIK